MTFGDTLKKLRIEKDLTQDEFAQKLSLAKSTISLYETGKREPDYKTIKIIAEFFGVTVDYLLGFSNEKTGKADLKIQTIDGRTLEGFEIFAELTKEEQKQVLDLLKGLKAKSELDKQLKGDNK